MNQQVGRQVQESVLAIPKSVQEIDGNTDEYIVYSDDIPGCRWSFNVDKKTKVIESWRYLANPDDCYFRLNIFGPP